MQNSITRFIGKQLAEAAQKNRLDAEIKIEQEKNKFTTRLTESEKALNAKLEEEIDARDAIAAQLKSSKEQIKSIISNLIGFTYRCIPDDLGSAREIISEAITGKKKFDLDYRLVKRSGEIVWVQENGRPVFDKAGNTLYLDGITMEITDKKNAEQAILDAKQELERLNRQLEKRVEERTAKLTRANTQVLKLQKENLQSQFEVLKQQINPHFLFNSLNVLTSLIKVDSDLAEMFTKKLSKVYRYVLENKEKA